MICACQPQDGDWTTGEGYAHFDQQTITEDEVSTADVTLANGQSALANLIALELARDGIIDAITFGPFNKAALIEAGLAMKMSCIIWLNSGVETYISELNTLDGVWTSRVQPYRAERRARLYHRPPYL